jgi:hypothetical protein
MKISTPAVVFFSLLLAGISFYSGMNFSKTGSTTTPDIKATTTLITSKSDKPELKFFVMSFCPYGNQMEDVLRPVYDLLQDKVALTPQYIFDKIENLGEYCKTRSGDPAQCSAYVKNGYFKTEAECKKAIGDNLASCQDEKNYLKSSTGVFYGSLHGRTEANQNIREMCAWKQVADKKVWWDFVGNVNKNCTSDNADTCWEEQGKSVGLDTQKVAECFNQEAFTLIEEQIAETTKYTVSGSPTVMINGILFPPESAYTQDGKGSILIGKKVATQDRYRTPNVIKEAVCASMNKAAKECNTTLPDLSGAAPAAGGC